MYTGQHDTVAGFAFDGLDIVEGGYRALGRGEWLDGGGQCFEGAGNASLGVAVNLAFAGQGAATGAVGGVVGCGIGAATAIIVPVAQHRATADLTGDDLVNINDIITYVHQYNNAHDIDSTSPSPSTAYPADIELLTFGRNPSGTSYDGVINVNENIEWSTAFGATPPAALGAGWISDPRREDGPDNIVGYAGYVFDVEAGGRNCARVRYFDSCLGRWLSPEPLIAPIGFNQYLYGKAAPATLVDATGLFPSTTATPQTLVLQWLLAMENAGLTTGQIAARLVAKGVSAELMKTLGYATLASLMASHVTLSEIAPLTRWGGRGVGEALKKVQEEVARQIQNCMAQRGRTGCVCAQIIKTRCVMLMDESRASGGVGRCFK